MPVGGGAPREVLENVLEADWTPDGRDLCVLRAGEGRLSIELPAGTPLYESARELRLLRVSPDGRRIAFVEGSEARLRIVSVEIATKAASVLAANLPANLFGLAWAPKGREIWFTAGDTTAQRDIMAVDLSGKQRLVYRSLATASLLDVAADGRALLHRGSDRWGTRAKTPDTRDEVDFSIFDASVPASLSFDGQTLLQDEFSAAAGAGAVYVRRIGAGPAVRLSDGLGWDLSRDGRSALVKRGNPPRLFEVPTGPGPRDEPSSSAPWCRSGGNGCLPTRSEPWSRAPMAIAPCGSGSWTAPRPRAPSAPKAASTNFAIAPDGRTVAARIVPGAITLLPIDGGAGRELRGVPDDLVVGSFSGDGQGAVPGPHQRERALRGVAARPSERAGRAVDEGGAQGCHRGEPVCLDEPRPDGRTYAYGYFQALGDLFLAEGFR